MDITTLALMGIVLFGIGMLLGIGFAWCIVQVTE